MSEIDAPPEERYVSVWLTRREWREVYEWMHEHGYGQQPGESLDHWRKRTAEISYPYALIQEAAGADEK